ncbi:MAG: TraR/DksA family transcriptional regulator [Spirochaetes bacterium]|nr:TraR/DksA family transcriptional regulator [Spirochaetota bacterium]
MRKDKLEHYKELLLKEKQEVLNELLETDESAKALLEDESHNVNDSIDLATSTITQNLLKTMNQKNQQKIMAIEAALRRIGENGFGVCISCGSNIEESRLEAIPWTTKCMKCKSDEQKKKHQIL